MSMQYFVCCFRKLPNYCSSAIKISAPGFNQSYSLSTSYFVAISTLNALNVLFPNFFLFRLLARSRDRNSVISKLIIIFFYACKQPTPNSLTLLPQSIHPQRGSSSKNASCLEDCYASNLTSTSTKASTLRLLSL